MATVVPTAAQVRKQAFGRPKIVEALQLLGVDAHHKTGAKALKAQLLQLLEGGPAGDGGGGGGDGMRVDSAGAPLAPAAGAGNPCPAPVGDSRDVSALVERMRGAHGAYTANDITFSVRSMLDQQAHSLPGAMGSLRPIDKQVETVRACLQDGVELPVKLHRTVRACLAADDPCRRDAMLAVLQLDLDVRIKALQDKQAQAKSCAKGAAGSARPGADPVLKAMGYDGLDRALWEYYKACAVKKPVWGQRAKMPYGPDSYIGQLHASLSDLLDPRVVQACKHMHSPKALRDFVVGWCFFWQQCRPPFLNVGPRANWVRDQWEELPMHEIEDADGTRPLPCAIEPAVADDDAGASDDEDLVGETGMQDGDECEPAGGGSFCERQAVRQMLAEGEGGRR
jgi:hypothetical protein